jgi:hypothetical protein
MSQSIQYKMPEKGDLIDVQYRHANKGGALQETAYKGLRDDAEVGCLADLKYKEVE